MTTERGPLRVAFFGNLLSASLGGRTACEDLADQLQARGAQVVRASTWLNPARRLADMLVTAVANRRRYDVACIDVFSGPGFMWAEAVAATARLLGKPYVLVLRGGQLPGFATRHRRRVRRLLGGARVVVAPSPYLSEGMRAYRDDIRVISQAIDLPRYPGRVRASVEPKLVWLRSFHAIYNPALAVRVLAAVLERYPLATLVMAGPDKGDGSREAAVAEAARLGVGASLRLPGNVAKPEVPALLDGHDILINTADIDNTPVSLIEAMACGLCVVTTDVGGIRMLCRNGETALLVPPDDPDAMAAACLALLDDPALAHRLSAGGIAEAAAFNRSDVLPQWEAVLASAAREGR